jgi:hypothetical protein
MYLLWWNKPLPVVSLLFEVNPLEGGIIGVETYRGVKLVEELAPILDLNEIQLDSPLTA